MPRQQQHGPGQDLPLSEGRGGTRSAQEMTPARRIGLRHLAGAAVRVFGRRSAQEAEPVDALDAIDRVIPSIVDDFHPETGRRYQREKELHAAAVREATNSTFRERFPDSYDELVGATESLFERFIVGPVRGDTVHLADIDHFLAGYPSNVIDGLGDQASAENILAVIQTGERLLAGSDEETSMASLQLSNKGYLAQMLSSGVPQLVAHEGVEGLRRFETIVSKDHVLAGKSYLEFRLKYKGGMPAPALDPEEAVDEVAPNSPFMREEADVAWRQESGMGIEERPPEWGDLAMMVARTDQWDREYGLKFKRAMGGDISTAFMRGGDGAIKNKGALGYSGDIVFFHSHPSRPTADGLYAPLISSGDVYATESNDGGGAYLNIVCKSGVTLLVDSQPLESETPNGPVYTVESGDLRGSVFVSRDTSRDQRDEILRKLRDSQGPYLYSIDTTEATLFPRKHTFVHIPWQHLDASGVTLEELCFGDGLRRIIPAALVPAGESPQNLLSAINEAKSLSD